MMLLLALATCGFFAICHSAPAPQFVSNALLWAWTDNGPVQGSASPLGISWKGIPYAQPPTGTRRWQHSVPAESWWHTGIKTTEHFQAGCPQYCAPPSRCPNVTSEDCLYLNVFTPYKLNDDPLPVFVWIHGGAYETGSGGIQIFDGSELAHSANKIVVTISYRLGALGFLAAPGIAGQFGLLDQRLALQWVQNNIKHFGGDSSQVTIAGESSGANSVAFHLVSQGSWPLFSKAIMHSNPGGSPFLTETQAYTQGGIFLEYSGCSAAPDVAACLLSLPVELVVEVQLLVDSVILKIPSRTLGGQTWVPLVDGVEVTDQPIHLFAAGKFANVPVIIGDVSEEGRVFIPMVFPLPLDLLQFEQIVGAFFGAGAPYVLEYYGTPSTDYRTNLEQIVSDFLFVCPNRYIADSISKYSTAGVYFFYFSHAYTNTGGSFINPAICAGHVCHAEEMPFLFGFKDYDYTPTTDEVALKHSLTAYWSNFVSTGNPNGAGHVAWPQFSATSDVFMQLTVPQNQAIPDPRAPYCAFWNQFGYVH